MLRLQRALTSLESIDLYTLIDYNMARNKSMRLECMTIDEIFDWLEVKGFSFETQDLFRGTMSM